MRIEGSVTAISWIPSEAIEGLPKLPFELGIGHYDEPPPDRLEPGDLGRLRDADRFREANELKAWIEVEDGTIVDHGYRGRRPRGLDDVPPRAEGDRRSGSGFDVLRTEPEVSGEQRPVRADRRRARGLPGAAAGQGRAAFRIHSATAWTTLALTLHADGRVEHELVGASPFPRHWIYDHDGASWRRPGRSTSRRGTARSHGDNTPWGDEESEAVVTAAESALERELSRELMSRRRGSPAELDEGEVLVSRAGGRRALPPPRRRRRVEVDGEEVAEIGPGAILGERAPLEGGVRTATLARSRLSGSSSIPAELVAGASSRARADRRRED